MTTSKRNSPPTRRKSPAHFPRQRLGTIPQSANAVPRSHSSADTVAAHPRFSAAARDPAPAPPSSADAPRSPKYSARPCSPTPIASVPAQTVQSAFHSPQLDREIAPQRARQKCSELTRFTQANSTTPSLPSPSRKTTIACHFHPEALRKTQQ